MSYHYPQIYIIHTTLIYSCPCLCMSKVSDLRSHIYLHVSSLVPFQAPFLVRVMQPAQL